MSKGRIVRKFKWLYLSPVLAFLVLACWAFASPIGAGPDDDYHLTSIWCASGGSQECQPGNTANTRLVSEPLTDIACYSRTPEKSADCLDGVMTNWNKANVQTDRGNFAGEYPPVYYAVMHLVAGPDLFVSALTMRLFNAALFVAIATSLFVLLKEERRRTLLWGWLLTLVPLGVFLIPSNNPSGWAITGVGTAFLATLGWYEAVGRRRWLLGSLLILGVVIAAGARGDGAVYAAGAVLTASILTDHWRQSKPSSWWRVAIMPAIAVVVCAFFFAIAGQSGVAEVGFTGGAATMPGGPPGSPRGFALAAYNLLMLPFLWTGVWGTWPLGWLDTGMPDLVPWAAASAFIAVGFVAIGRLNLRKLIAAGGVFLVLVILPVWVLTRGGNVVGENLQPRYLLPVIVLFGLILFSMPSGKKLDLSRVQILIVLGAIWVAQLVALQVNLRRYVTGTDEQGFNLDAGAEWWWSGFPIGPTALWFIGCLAFAGLLATLWPILKTAKSQSFTEERLEAGRFS
ncbi:MAG: DUF2142 domain-containing protein [Cryobacterium sp.]|nr:DUF2142 domain-containing protein [Cryobacterium sp.]MBX3104106.1 DUF2142 domain-containing protein [Cryobacterium sp.]